VLQQDSQDMLLTPTPDVFLVRRFSSASVLASMRLARAVLAIVANLGC
jgi:hypothetical protein